MRIRADTPRPPPAQLDAVLAQDPPHGIVRYAQRLGQRTAVPTRQPLRWRLLQLPQDPQPKRRPVGRRLARPRPIPQARHAPRRKSLAPQAYRIGAYPQATPNLVVALAFQARQHNPGALDQPRLRRAASRQRHQLRTLRRRTLQFNRHSRHGTPHLVHITVARYLISYYIAIRH